MYRTRLVDVSSNALPGETDPKPFQVTPSVEYCQLPFPALEVTATPLDEPVSTSDQSAVVRIASTVVGEEVVSSSVAANVAEAPVYACSEPGPAKVPGELTLLYFVRIQPAERAVLSTLTSSRTPLRYPSIPLPSCNEPGLLKELVVALDASRTPLT